MQMQRWQVRLYYDDPMLGKKPLGVPAAWVSVIGHACHNDESGSVCKQLETLEGSSQGRGFLSMLDETSAGTLHAWAD